LVVGLVFARTSLVIAFPADLCDIERKKKKWPFKCCTPPRAKTRFDHSSLSLVGRDLLDGCAADDDDALAGIPRVARNET